MHPTQVKILNLCLANNLGSLTLRQIGEIVGESHPQKIRHHLDKLIERGLIKYDKDTKKITVIKKYALDNKLITIPIMGAANCGPALAIASNYIEGYIKVSASLLGSKTKSVFALEASGDSMNNANVNGKTIDDGDYVLVDSSYRNPQNGDYVVSIIDGMANIKRFYQDEENQQILLLSESTNKYPPIFISLNEAGEYLVSGRVIQVIKNQKR